MKFLCDSAMGQVLLAVILCSVVSLSTGRSLSDNLLSPQKRECEVYQNEALHSVLDKLCGDCSDMYRHEIPDLYSKCRRNCFENKVFNTCWEAINPGVNGPTARK